MRYLIVSLVLLTISNINAQFSDKTLQAKIAEEINLSDNDIEVFKDQTKQKIEELQQHIVIMGSKEETSEVRNLAEKEAIKLFYKGAEMQTSYIAANGSVSVQTRTIDKYFGRLKSLPYSKVIINFFDIVYLTSFTRGADGRYYSTATIIQEFTGFTGDNIAYKDVTKKDIEIVIDLVDDKFFNEKKWKVLLGNIKATETKSI